MAAKTFQAKIELGGQLHASLSGAVRAAQNQLSRLGNAARAISAKIGAAFSKVGSFLKSFAGQLIGVTLAFAGLRSASEFIAKSKEQYEANTAAAARLGAAIRNNTSITQQGAKVTAEQEKRVAAWADQMQEISPYASAIWKEGAVSLLQYGATAKEIEKVGSALNNVLASKKGVKATTEDAKALASAIGSAVAKGKLGKLGRDLVVTKDEEKRFAKMRTSAERLDFLIGKIQKKYGGQAKALVGTPAYEIAQAQNKIADFQARVGEGFVRIEAKWISFVSRLVPYLEPAIAKAAEVFETGLTSVVNFVENSLIPGWQQWSDAIKDPALVAEWDRLGQVASQVLEPIQKGFELIGEAIRKVIGLKPGEEITKAFVIEGITQRLQMVSDDFEKIGGIIQKVKGFVDGLVNLIREIKLPDLGGFKMPEISAEAFKLPDLSKAFTDFKWPTLPAWLTSTTKKAFEFEIPKIEWPKWELPKLEFPKFTLPSLEWPKWELPKLAFPDFKWPALPELKIPDVKWPDWQLPELKFPAFDVPMPDFSSIVASINDVKSAVDSVAKALSAWDIPGALKSGLDRVVQKAGQAAAAIRGAAGAGGGAALAGGGGGGQSSGTSGGWQHGGIVTSPTFGALGEAGPEAVIPLQRSAGNMGLLSQAAAAMGIRGGAISVNYNPAFTINGGGPEVGHQVEAIVRRAHDELLQRIGEADHELLRRAFV